MLPVFAQAIYVAHNTDIVDPLRIIVVLDVFPARVLPLLEPVVPHTHALPACAALNTVIAVPPRIIVELDVRQDVPLKPLPLLVCAVHLILVQLASAALSMVIAEPPRTTVVLDASKVVLQLGPALLVQPLTPPHHHLPMDGLMVR